MFGTGIKTLKTNKNSMLIKHTDELFAKHDGRAEKNNGLGKEDHATDRTGTCLK